VKSPLGAQVHAQNAKQALSKSTELLANSVLLELSLLNELQAQTVVPNVLSGKSHYLRALRNA
jgi:hypothetical protein